MPNTFEIVAMSALAERLHESEGKVRDAVARLGIKPPIRINGEDHLEESDADRVRRYLAEQEGKA